MKKHTQEFKEKIKLMGREIDSKITFGEIELGKEQLNSVTPVLQSALLKSVMKELDIDSNVEIPVGTIINYKFGVLLDSGNYEYLDFGNYQIYSSEKQEDTNSYNIVAYDKMLNSMVEYKGLKDKSKSFPMTVENYIMAICEDINLTLASPKTKIANYDKIIETDLYAELEYTYRDVLDELAQVTASNIVINENDELEIKYINKNIAQRTNEGIYGWGWGLGAGGRTIEEVVEDGIRCVKLTRNDTPATSWSYISYSPIGRQYYKPGTTYIISFEVKPSANKGFTSIALVQSNAQESLLKSTKIIKNITTANQWNKIIAQVIIKDELPTSTSQLLYITGMNSDPGVSYIFRNLMILEGTYEEFEETIDEEYLKDINVKFGEKYGKINSIVLSRSAESDNVYLQDENSVAYNGLCELKISDNQIMNFNNRSDYLPDILEKLNGIEYYINDFSSTGICYYDVTDKYNVKIGENIYPCVMFNDQINVTQGLEEIIHTDLSEQAETDYTKADKTDRRINQTYLIVDKQNQIIESVITRVETQDKKLDQAIENTNNLSANFNDFKDNEYLKSIQNLQDQIDGAIQFWKGNEIPTLNNYPANNWSTNKDKDNHLGDIYYLYGKDENGETIALNGYRFDNVDGQYQWIILSDTELAAVQKLAEEAQKNADEIKKDLQNNYSTTTEMNNAITQKITDSENSIQASVSKQIKDSEGNILQNVDGKLELYIEKGDTNEVISAFNLAVDQVEIHSKNFDLTKDGDMTAHNVDIQGGTLDLIDDGSEESASIKITKKQEIYGYHITVGTDLKDCYMCINPGLIGNPPRNDIYEVIGKDLTLFETCNPNDETQTGKIIIKYPTEDTCSIRFQDYGSSSTKNLFLYGIDEGEYIELNGTIKKFRDLFKDAIATKVTAIGTDKIILNSGTNDISEIANNFYWYNDYNKIIDLTTTYSSLGMLTESIDPFNMTIQDFYFSQLLFDDALSSETSRSLLKKPLPEQLERYDFNKDGVIDYYDDFNNNIANFSQFNLSDGIKQITKIKSDDLWNPIYLYDENKQRQTVLTQTGIGSNRNDINPHYGTNLTGNFYINVDSGFHYYGNNQNGETEFYAGYFLKNGKGYSGIYTPYGITVGNNTKHIKSFNAITSGNPYFEIVFEDIGAYGINMWACDKRLKENIQDTEYTALDKILAIKHRQFDYKVGGHANIGYIADELEEIDKNYIFEVGDDKLKQPSINVIIPTITKAIQEQQEIINKLQKEIEDLKKGR